MKALIERLGAHPTTDGIYTHRLITRVGPLLLAAHDGWLATRFENVDSATALLNPYKVWGNRLNPHSGKWNFHEDDLSFIESTIRGILE